ncbi:MAG: DNA polymerase Y family protein [Paracoccaceae bacterium]
MALRRILSLWFPRLATDRLLRQRHDAPMLPFAVVGERRGAQTLVSLTPEAEAAGLRQGQALRDAMAMCPALLTAPENTGADEVFLRALCRWAGKFSPWVALDLPDAIVLDLTGCAHLFGGEQGLVQQIEADCADLRLTVRAGIADSRGAAWAMARYSDGLKPALFRSGSEIRQEARATRSRAARHDRVGEASVALRPSGAVIAASGQMRQVLGPMPLAALRLSPETVEGLARLGLRRVQDIIDMPRAALARRFGTEVLRRLDQALGFEPEPVNPAATPPLFAVRLSFPDPIGLREDVAAGVDRLLPPLCAKLQAAGQGARRVRLEAHRSDGQISQVEVSLARATPDPDRIRPLLALKLDAIDAGLGIDRLRLVVPHSETMPQQQSRGTLMISHDTSGPASAAALDDLIGRLGAKIGPEAVTRLHPASTHIPGKTANTLAAAWCLPAPVPWPRPPAPRPILFFRPEPVRAPDDSTPPARFHWRGREHVVRVAIGAERLMPEWWFDDPEWRSGPRDYWRIEVDGGDRLWLFYAHGGEVSSGWFCHGIFA